MAFAVEEKIGEENARKYKLNKVEKDIRNKISKKRLPFRCYPEISIELSWRIDRELGAWLINYGSFSGFWDHCNLDFNAYRFCIIKAKCLIQSLLTALGSAILG
ncbi:hypothetical protein [uncultured Campylobacter sp.]|uniref:hypothetical protein n=1 Tax=uncultured Campylobacter sp. TaxID=218934 RepID=UPI002626DC7A|nr:hypothetical protein [uncultured Campylobacter sp.]